MNCQGIHVRYRLVPDLVGDATAELTGSQRYWLQYFDSHRGQSRNFVRNSFEHLHRSLGTRINFCKFQIIDLHFLREALLHI